MEELANSGCVSLPIKGNAFPCEPTEEEEEEEEEEDTST